LQYYFDCRKVRSGNSPVAIVKQGLKLPASLDEMSPVLSLAMFERTPLNQLLGKIDADGACVVSANQKIPPTNIGTLLVYNDSQKNNPFFNFMVNIT
jgi:hypothetical protein